MKSTSELERFCFDKNRHTQLYQNGYFEEGNMEIRMFVYVNSAVVCRCYVYDVTPSQRFTQRQFLSRDRVDTTP